MPTGSARNAVTIGLVLAFIGLFLFPEIFDSIAIILGAYAWRKEQGNTGLFVVIIGIVFLLVALAFTAYYSLLFY